MLGFDFEDFRDTMLPLLKKSIQVSRVALHYGWLPSVLLYGAFSAPRITMSDLVSFAAPSP